MPLDIERGGQAIEMTRFWSDFISPHITNLACAVKPIRFQRTKIVPEATGVVLEIGFGSGLNLPFYDDDKVHRLIGIDPSEGMQRLARERIEETNFEVKCINAEAGDIPIETGAVDTVVCTYTLCTVPEPREALKEMNRILKVGGKLLFCEHGEAPDMKVRRFQRRMEPLWKIVAGGCHLTRNIEKLIDANGFQIGSLDRMYLPSTPRFVGYNIWGWAKS